MCVPLAPLALAATAVGSTLSAVGAYQQAKTAQAVARNNAVVAEYAAQDAERRGQLDAQEVQRKAAGQLSSQRVALAANGLDLGFGTAADIQDQTRFFAEYDAKNARYNGQLNAYNARQQGSNFRAQADAQNPALAGATSLLSGAGRVADIWYRQKG